MADVRHDRLVLHATHVLDRDHVLVARGRDEDVGFVHDVFERRHLIPFERRLQRADRVDFGDDHACALSLERLRTPLAHIAVAHHDGDLARKHDVGGAVQTIDDRVTATVQVVELRLGHGVVHVDGREGQRTCALHLVQAMHARRGLFTHATNAGQHLRPTARVLRLLRAQQVENHPPFFRLVVAVEARDHTALFVLGALVHEQRGVATVIEQQVRTRAVAPHQRLLGAPPVLLERLTLPREHRRALGLLHRAVRTNRHGGRGVVLRAEDVARHPTHIGAEGDQRFDEHGRLHRHVQRAHDLRALERMLAGILVAECHEPRHLEFSETNFLAAPLGEREITHGERGTIERRQWRSALFGDDDGRHLRMDPEGRVGTGIHGTTRRGGEQRGAGGIGIHR